MGRSSLIRRRFTWSASALLLAWSVLTSGACGTEAAENEVRDVLDSCERAIEDRDVDALTDHVSPRFAGRNGLSRDDLIDLLAERLRHAGPIHLLVVEKRLDVTKDERADVRLVVALAPVPLDSVLNLSPTVAELGRLRLTLRNEGGAWKITDAHWSEASANDFL